MEYDDQQPERLAPHLIQSLEVLRMNWADLEIHIDRELNKNPCLEYVRFDQAVAQAESAEPPVPQTKADAKIVKGPKDGYLVEIRTLIRELRIKDDTKQTLSNDDSTTDEKQFTKQMINKGLWLIESVQQRKNTLTKIIQEIIQYQTNYLASGDAADLLILKMESIAESVGCSVDAVSRSVDRKSLETPHGKIALSSFVEDFEISRTNQGNEVRHAIVKLVDEEDKSAPYSDYQLVNKLKTLGYNVARRTVTKHRKVLNIPSARQRRDWGDKA